MNYFSVLIIGLGGIAGFGGCGGAGPHAITHGGGDDGGGGGDGGMVDMTVSFGGPDLALVCMPMGAPICDGDTAVQTCRADGSGYDSMPCPDGTTCAAGACGCTPGNFYCMGNDVVRCGVDMMLHPDHSCPGGTVCALGFCSDPRCPEELIVTMNPNALSTAGWPRFRHDNRNTGTTVTVVADKPKLKWSTFIGGTNLNNQTGLASGPVVSQDDLILIGGGDLDGKGGSYYEVSAAGKILFTFSAQRGYGLSTPAVRLDDTSYFSTTTSKLFAVDQKGNQAWMFATASQADSDPVVTKDGNLIYSSDDGSVYGLSPTGVLLWKSDPQVGPGEVDGGLAESCDGRIYAGGKNGWFALDAATGKTLFSVPATGNYSALLSSPLVTADGRMYGFDSGGQGVALDPKGKVIWQKQFGPSGAGSSVALSGGTLYVVLNDGALHAIDPTSGKEKWAKPTGNTPHVYLNAGPIADGRGRIYFNSTDGNVYAFDTTGAVVWKLPLKGAPQSMVWSGTMAIGKDGTLYAPGTDGKLYAYQ